MRRLSDAKQLSIHETLERDLRDRSSANNILAIYIIHLSLEACYYSLVYLIILGSEVLHVGHSPTNINFFGFFILIKTFFFYLSAEQQA